MKGSPDATSCTVDKTSPDAQRHAVAWREADNWESCTFTAYWGCAITHLWTHAKHGQQFNSIKEPSVNEQNSKALKSFGASLELFLFRNFCRLSSSTFISDLEIVTCLHSKLYVIQGLTRKFQAIRFHYYFVLFLKTIFPPCCVIVTGLTLGDPNLESGVTWRWPHLLSA